MAVCVTLVRLVWLLGLRGTGLRGCPTGLWNLRLWEGEGCGEGSWGEAREGAVGREGRG
jgi:hypothetical protein